MTLTQQYQLEGLIERLEKATVSDQPLVLQAAVEFAYNARWLSREQYQNASLWIIHGAYESAALTLAPTDSALGLAIYLEDNPDNERGRYRATIMPPLSFTRGSDQTVYGLTLALAVACASLKSRVPLPPKGTPKT